MSTTSIDTAYFNPLEDSVTSSGLLGSADGSVGPTQLSNKQISRDYDIAQSNFSNKQFQEAHQVLETLISPTSSNGDTVNEKRAQKAPITAAKSSLRVKTWVLYFKLLDAVIGLGPNEGVEDLALSTQKNLKSKVVDSSIWEQVLQDGYGGTHCNVEAEVVWHLGQLVFLHAHDQKENQRHLENYISTSSQPGSSNRELRFQRSVLHLLTTNVLPSNGEWDYARTLVDHSDILTEDERDPIRQQLNEAEAHNEMEEDGREADEYQELLPNSREKDNEQGRHEQVRETTYHKQNSTDGPEPTIPLKPPHHRHDSQKDFGIDDPNPSVSNSQPTPKSSLKPSSRSLQPQSTNSFARKSVKHPATSIGVYKRSAALVNNFQRLINSLTNSAFRNPMALLRFVLFLVGVVVALSRRDVKARLRQAWEKVQRTVGMGVKVSYI